MELGEFDISGATEFMPTRQAKVKRVVVHKDYQAPTFENDIAILELVRDVNNTAFHRTLTLGESITFTGGLQFYKNEPVLLHYIQITTYFHFWSNSVSLNWRPSLQ